MKNTHMILYTASVIGFYISLVLLYLNTASVTGTALLCMSILTLALGVFAQWRSSCRKHLWVAEKPVCVAAESASC